MAGSWKSKKLQTIPQNIKHKLSKICCEITSITHFYPILMNKYPSSPGQSFGGFLDVWKDDSALRVSGKCFQIWRPEWSFIMVTPNNITCLEYKY